MISAFRFNGVAHTFSRRIISFRAGSTSSRLFSSVSPTSPVFTLNERKPIAVTASSGQEFSGDLLVIPFFQFDQLKADEIQKRFGSKAPSSFLSTISSVVADGSFKGKSGTDQIIRLPTENSSGSKYLALVGLGKKKSTSSSSFPGNDAMNLGKSIIKLAEKVNARSIGITLFDNTLLSKESISQILMGIYDGSYQDTRYKKQTETLKEEKSLKMIDKVIFLNGSEGKFEEISKTINDIAKRIEAINNGVDFAKDIVGNWLSCC
jgi:leucyl aminopeptidase